MNRSLERRLERIEQYQRRKPELSDEELDARIVHVVNALGGIDAARAVLIELGSPHLIDHLGQSGPL